MTDAIKSTNNTNEPTTAKGLIILGLMLVGILTFLDALGLINGGGLLSLPSKISAINEAQPVINIDDAVLRTVFATFTCVLALVAIHLLKLSIKSRWVSTIATLVIVFGGFGLDAYADERIVTRYLNMHGYRRCVLGDFARGNGKSRVWFSDYTRDELPCARKAAPIKGVA